MQAILKGEVMLGVAAARVIARLRPWLTVGGSLPHPAGRLSETPLLKFARWLLSEVVQPSTRPPVRRAERHAWESQRCRRDNN